MTLDCFHTKNACSTLLSIPFHFVPREQIRVAGVVKFRRGSCKYVVDTFIKYRIIGFNIVFTCSISETLGIFLWYRFRTSFSYVVSGFLYIYDDQPTRTQCVLSASRYISLSHSKWYREMKCLLQKAHEDVVK